MKIVTSPSESQVKKLFSIKDNSNTFRYFDNRDFSCIQNHLFTFLVYEKGEPIGYGHLDPEDGIIWLGIYVSPEYRSKGYGKTIMAVLLTNVESDIQLTVDKTNTAAIKLYNNFGFIIKDENKKYYTMKFKNG
tara:strand:+ start:1139 stop:1537 length:399 start_codon:yes stop_codon:yes gene_type:complete